MEPVYVPYQQIGEVPTKAVISHIPPLDLSDFTENELKMLSLLTEACDMMNILYWDLGDKNMHLLVEVLRKMELVEGISAEEKSIIHNYYLQLLIQNSPYSELPTKNHQMKIPKKRASEIMSLFLHYSVRLSLIFL